MVKTWVGTIVVVYLAFVCYIVAAPQEKGQEPKKDEPKKEAPKEEPKKEEPKEDSLTQEEAAELFKKGMEHHQNKEYAEAIAIFKRISNKFPKENGGFTAAYNAACAYALKGEKAPALEWLETSINNGFDQFDHIEKDTDLDSLRDEPKYKELMNRKPM